MKKIIFLLIIILSFALFRFDVFAHEFLLILVMMNVMLMMKSGII